MNPIRFWLNNSRYNSLPQSVLPALTAVCLAYGHTGFSWLYALLGVFGVITGHLGLNLFDDYFDYRKKNTGYRNEMVREGMRARISKCAYLTSGAATLKQLLVACLVFSGLALVIGFLIYLKRGEVILYLTFITALLGVSYSGAPLRLSYRGLGELQVGIMFGPLLMVGVYYAACGHIAGSVLFASLPIGLLVANILYVHSIMDFEPDRKVGKMTLAVLLNNRTLMLVALGILLFLPFLIIVYGIGTGYLSPYYGIVFLCFPWAFWLFSLMVAYVKDPHRVFKRKAWMGPMNNWKRIEQAGIEWFMIRWYLARNLLSLFCLIIAVIGLLS